MRTKIYLLVLFLALGLGSFCYAQNSNAVSFINHSGDRGVSVNFAHGFYEVVEKRNGNWYTAKRIRIVKISQVNMRFDYFTQLIKVDLEGAPSQYFLPDWQGYIGSGWTNEAKASAVWPRL